MKSLVVFAVTVAVVTAQFGPRYRRPQQVYQPIAAASVQNVRRAAPQRFASSDQAANVLRYDNDINPDGSYSWSYETDNGIAAQEQGTPRDLGGNPPARPDVAQGSYSYTSPEGLPVSVSYIADENGFQPTSDVLPVAPPVPPQIQRALEWLAKNAPPQRKK